MTVHLFLAAVVVLPGLLVLWTRYIEIADQQPDSKQAPGGRAGNSRVYKPTPSKNEMDGRRTVDG